MRRSNESIEQELRSKLKDLANPGAYLFTVADRHWAAGSVDAVAPVLEDFADKLHPRPEIVQNQGELKNRIELLLENKNSLANIMYVAVYLGKGMQTKALLKQLGHPFPDANTVQEKTLQYRSLQKPDKIARQARADAMDDVAYVLLQQSEATPIRDTTTAFTKASVIKNMEHSLFAGNDPAHVLYVSQRMGCGDVVAAYLKERGYTFDAHGNTLFQPAMQPVATGGGDDDDRSTDDEDQDQAPSDEEKAEDEDDEEESSREYERIEQLNAHDEAEAGKKAAEMYKDDATPTLLPALKAQMKGSYLNSLKMSRDVHSALAELIQTAFDMGHQDIVADILAKYPDEILTRQEYNQVAPFSLEGLKAKTKMALAMGNKRENIVCIAVCMGLGQTIKQILEDLDCPFPSAKTLDRLTAWVKNELERCSDDVELFADECLARPFVGIAATLLRDIEPEDFEPLHTRLTDSDIKELKLNMKRALESGDKPEDVLYLAVCTSWGLDAEKILKEWGYVFESEGTLKQFPPPSASAGRPQRSMEVDGDASPDEAADDDTEPFVVPRTIKANLYRTHTEEWQHIIYAFTEGRQDEVVPKLHIDELRPKAVLHGKVPKKFSDNLEHYIKLALDHHNKPQNIMLISVCLGLGDPTQVILDKLGSPLHSQEFITRTHAHYQTMLRQASEPSAVASDACKLHQEDIAAPVLRTSGAQPLPDSKKRDFPWGNLELGVNLSLLAGNNPSNVLYVAQCCGFGKQTLRYLAKLGYIKAFPALDPDGLFPPKPRKTKKIDSGDGAGAPDSDDDQPIGSLQKKISTKATGSGSTQSAPKGLSGGAPESDDDKPISSLQKKISTKATGSGSTQSAPKGLSGGAPESDDDKPIRLAKTGIQSSPPGGIDHQVLGMVQKANDKIHRHGKRSISDSNTSEAVEQVLNIVHLAFEKLKQDLKEALAPYSSAESAAKKQHKPALFK